MTAPRPATLLFPAALLAASCATDPAPPRPSAPEATPAAAAPSPEAAPVDGAFRVGVRPILERRCAPCHEPGGKMYDKLPFDDPAVVAAHPEGVLKRLTDEEESRAVREWLATAVP